MTRADKYPAFWLHIDLAFPVRAVMRERQEARGMMHQQKLLFPEVSDTARGKLSRRAHHNIPASTRWRAAAEKELEQYPELGAQERHACC
jgi:hypothetical protein